MNNQDIGQEILDGIKEIKQLKTGKGNVLITRQLKDPSPAKIIREKLSLSQDAFASLMGVKHKNNTRLGTKTKRTTRASEITTTCSGATS